VGVSDQGVPFGVDVKLHRPNCTDVLENLRRGDHGLVVGGHVDKVALTADADAAAPDRPSRLIYSAIVTCRLSKAT
jgi:hypothetical protein